MWEKVCIRSSGLLLEFLSSFPSLSGFYSSTFLQLVNGSKDSILNRVFKLNLFKSLQVFFFFFFVSLSRKTLDRFLVLLHHHFYSYKPQICTKQTCLTIWFHDLIPWKNLCSCIQKIKNKHAGGADVVFFLFQCALLTA